jgi:hypothetical protein
MEPGAEGMGHGDQSSKVKGESSKGYGSGQNLEGEGQGGDPVDQLFFNAMLSALCALRSASAAIASLLKLQTMSDL